MTAAMALVVFDPFQAYSGFIYVHFHFIVFLIAFIPSPGCSQVYILGVMQQNWNFVTFCVMVIANC